MKKLKIENVKITPPKGYYAIVDTNIKESHKVRFEKIVKVDFEKPKSIIEKPESEIKKYIDNLTDSDFSIINIRGLDYFFKGKFRSEADFYRLDNPFYSWGLDIPPNYIVDIRKANFEEIQSVYKKLPELMPLNDFTHAWVGQTVYDPVRFPEGLEVVDIKNENEWPIKVRVGDSYCAYYFNGKYFDTDIEPSLYTRTVKIVEI